MNQEIKDKWISALESGEYQQGYGSYHKGDPETYCVMGVLLDVLKRESRLDEYVPQISYLMIAQHLVPCMYHVDELIDMNDRGMPFPDLAIWIKENV